MLSVSVVALSCMQSGTRSIIVEVIYLVQQTAARTDCKQNTD